jgi:hypothetical protein
VPKTFPFPQDLLDAQAALDETSAAYQEYAATLPWSAEPMSGWKAKKQLDSDDFPRKPDSPGYTEEQRAEVARFRARLMELNTTVFTHPFWGTLTEDVAAARTALKHAHEPAGAEA